jgi:glycosyltransferase involved in cell wall biosynthesis
VSGAQDGGGRKKVVFLINSLAGGGAERVMVTLLRHSEHRRSDTDIHLVLLDDHPPAYDCPRWLAIHRLDSRGSLARSILQVGLLFRRLRPDVCLSFLTRSNLSNVLASGVTGHRTIISERAFTSTHHRASGSGRLARLLVATLYPRARRTIAVSAEIAKDLEDNFGVAADRIVTIPNGVDIEAVRAASAAALPVQLPEPYLVAAGRFVGTKNFALLLRAFAASGFPGGLVLLGQGPLRPQLEALARELGVADRLVMPGFQENPFPYLRRAVAYCLPSNHEGFPNGIIEAMALGLPVISTNCRSGPSEILDNTALLDIGGVHEGRYGILTPPDDVEAMIAAIKMIGDSEVRARYSRKAIEGIARYDIAATVARYWQVIDGAGR